MVLDPAVKTFVDYYYNIFDIKREELASLYQDSSMLTMNGQEIHGGDAIVEKLTSLPFQDSKHTISTIDCQSSGPGGGMLVSVTGTFALINGHVWELQQLEFSQTFHLVPTHTGSFFVFNDIVRFNSA